MATNTGYSVPRSADKSTRSKYSSTPADARSGRYLQMSEKSPLLGNMESLSIADRDNLDVERSEVITVGASIQYSQADKNEAINLPSNEKNTSSNKIPPDEKRSSGGNNNSVRADFVLNSERFDVTCDGKNLKQSSHASAAEGKAGESVKVTSNTGSKLDIVRKMSEPNSKDHVPWQKIGPYGTLKAKQCRRLYAKSGRADDLALFFHNGRFHAMGAWCSHMGGPLFQGDIEDYKGKCHVMCPWHSYMFDLETGNNEIGLMQDIHELKYENGLVYVRYHSEVFADPIRKASEVNPSPATKRKDVPRKESVLENVMKL